jgi:hypothetical protein
MELREAHAALVETLGQVRNADGGWPYYAGRKSRLEATCWAALGAGARLDTTPVTGWIAADGLLREPSIGQVNYAFNSLCALVLNAQADRPTPLGSRISESLREAIGVEGPPSDLIRLDPTLRGWSWTPGTVSWVEPTCWCLLLMKHWPEGTRPAQVRIRDAEAMLRDRCCPGGGWNYGNGEVLGKALPAHVPTTAVGVLALQDRLSAPHVAEAIRYLERQALTEPSTMALALSALALAAVQRPANGIVAALTGHAEAAVTFGNVAAIGMAAHALECAVKGIPSPVLAGRSRAA